MLFKVYSLFLVTSCLLKSSLAAPISGPNELRLQSRSPAPNPISKPGLWEDSKNKIKDVYHAAQVAKTSVAAAKRVQEENKRDRERAEMFKKVKNQKH
jgi:hypothetical protein